MYSSTTDGRTTIKVGGKPVTSDQNKVGLTGFSPGTSNQNKVGLTVFSPGTSNQNKVWSDGLFTFNIYYILSARLYI